MSLSVIPLKLQRSSVTVRVPATSANIGPGFDAIGIALDIWNELTVEEAPLHQEIFVTGEGSLSLPRDDTNLVIFGMKAAFAVGTRMQSSNGIFNEACRVLYTQKYTDVQLPPFKYTCINRIPHARGLGSSSAAIISGLLAGLVLLGIELPVTEEEALLNIACAIEGHPDNVAPALYGGLQIGVKYQEKKIVNGTTYSIDCPQWITSHVPVNNGLQCVLFLPDHTSQTAEARALLDDTVSRDTAIFNSSRTALLINALSTGAFHLLRIAMDDQLHQPQRSATVAKHLYPLIEAAVKAGAHGACLSGAGPSVLAITSGSKGDIFTQRQAERTDRAVAEAMLKAAQEANVKGRIFITHPTQKGAHVVSANPPFSEGGVCLFGGGDHL